MVKGADCATKPELSRRLRPIDVPMGDEISAGNKTTRNITRTSGDVDSPCERGTTLLA